MCRDSRSIKNHLAEVACQHIWMIISDVSHPFTCPKEFFLILYSHPFLNIYRLGKKILLKIFAYVCLIRMDTQCNAELEKRFSDFMIFRFMLVFY